MSDIIREVRESLSDPLALVRQLGIDKPLKRQRGGVQVCCPWHKDKSPSCSITTGRDGTIRTKCWSCGETGDVLSLIGAVHGIDIRSDFPRVLELAADLAGITLPPRRNHINKPSQPVDRVADIAFRINLAAEDFGAGRDIKPDSMVESATQEELNAAFDLLRDLDDRQDRKHAELTKLAIEWEAANR